MLIYSQFTLSGVDEELAEQPLKPRLGGKAHRADAATEERPTFPWWGRGGPTGRPGSVIESPDGARRRRSRQALCGSEDSVAYRNSWPSVRGSESPVPRREWFSLGSIPDPATMTRQLTPTAPTGHPIVNLERDAAMRAWIWEFEDGNRIVMSDEDLRTILTQAGIQIRPGYATYTPTA